MDGHEEILASIAAQDALATDNRIRILAMENDIRALARRVNEREEKTAQAPSSEARYWLRDRPPLTVALSPPPIPPPPQSSQGQIAAKLAEMAARAVASLLMGDKEQRAKDAGYLRDALADYEASKERADEP